MSNTEQSLTGFIIKSQDLGEADLLLTFFSEEQGKVRAMVKSAKKMTSKLSGHLQPYILVQATLVGENGLPKIISVQPLEKYSHLITDQQSMQVILAMQELVVRALPDGLPNPELFTIYHKILEGLNQNINPELAPVYLAKFYAQALLALGFAPRLLEASQQPVQTIFFSMQNGKFTERYQDSGDTTVSPEAYQLLLNLLSPIAVADLSTISVTTAELLTLLTKFAGYQLERELRAPLYFTVI
jgi:DNA repair protein RecO (recombination protein O)